MNMKHKIAKVDVHLVSYPIIKNFQDATRKVETIGYTIVRLTTDDGIEGFGVTYHEVGGEATKELILKNMNPRLIGRDPFETEVIWQDFFCYLRGIGRKGLMFCALSAVDIALWDLKGKILNQPLYKILGGSNNKIPVYASGGWTSYSDEELVVEVKEMVDSGYNLVKFKVGVDCGRNINRDVLRVEKVRDAVGPDIGIMLDANNCWDAATGIQFANKVKHCNIIFLEEPVFADDIPGLSRFKKGTDMPLATGEHEYTKYGVRDLVLSEAADVVQTDCTRTGGITESLKIAAITQAWNLKFAPHAMENIHIHLVSACYNALFLERLLMFEEITALIYRDCPVPDKGYMYIPDKPGLGLTLNMDFIKEKEE
ncbi:MAG: mandelate racemase/muconate lactonizing enzyme family protein [Treponema sp.]|jgi:L-alanine-DL-glutamate epimerase-like enolase superfamily enzyme|nr:mandelate racemase/muconate lactonizing enzyme family protein [Treponema sp.]